MEVIDRTDEPRVLVENPRIAQSLEWAVALRQAGFDVIRCAGPTRMAFGYCPLLADATCPLVEWADVVLFDLDLDAPPARDVLTRMRSLNPDKPIVVEVSPHVRRRNASLLQGCTTVAPFDVDKTVSAVTEAASARTGARPT